MFQHFVRCRPTFYHHLISVIQMFEKLSWARQEYPCPCLRPCPWLFPCLSLCPWHFLVCVCVHFNVHVYFCDHISLSEPMPMSSLCPWPYGYPCPCPCPLPYLYPAISFSEIPEIENSQLSYQRKKILYSTLILFFSRYV